MANFFIDHLQSGSGANDGTSGTGSWWSYKHAIVEANVSGTGVEPGDYIWARRVLSGSPAGELWGTGDSQVTATLQGDADDLVNIVRWPESGEPDYLMRPSGSHVDWDSDTASVYPTVRIDGSLGPSAMYSFLGFGATVSRFVRWRGTEFWSGSTGDAIFNVFNNRMWFEELFFWGRQGAMPAIFKTVGGVYHFKDCEWGTDTEFQEATISVAGAGVMIFDDCKLDTGSNDQPIDIISTGGNIFMRNVLTDTRGGGGNNVVNVGGTSTTMGRHHVYSRNGRHEETNYITVASNPVDPETAFFAEGDGFVPDTWERENENGVVLWDPISKVRPGSISSLEATPGAECGAFYPLSLLSSAPLNELSGVPVQVLSGTDCEIKVYMRPNGWTTEPDLTVEKPARRGECWVEAEYYIGSGTTRESFIKYSFSESQTALVNGAWTPVRVSNILPSEDGWILVRAFLGVEEGGSETLLVDPQIEVG